MYEHRRLISRCLVLSALLLIMSLPVAAMDAHDIIRQMDAMETFATSSVSGSIATTDRFGVKTTTFKAWSRGASDSLIEFTSAAERGQKILRTATGLYLYYPDAQEMIRLQGAALRQSMLGSDLSYEDMTAERDTLASYDATLEGQATHNDRLCHVLRLTAKSRTVAYPLQKLWIDTETYIVLKAEYSTATGRLLKTMEVLETAEIASRTIAVKTLISDKMKRDSSTLMTIDTLEVNIPLDPKLFSIEELTW